VAPSDPVATRTTAITALDRDLADRSRAAFMRMRPSNLQSSFVNGYLPEIQPRLVAAQVAAARIAGNTIVAQAGGELMINPAGFAGHMTSTGATIPGALTGPILGVYHDVDHGVDVDLALHRGANSLDQILTTEVHDTARAAEQVQLTADRTITYYVRQIEGGACGKCIILSGRRYKYSRFFERHDNCRCHLRPDVEVVDMTVPFGTSKIRSPREIFDSMTPEERVKAFGVNGAKAITDGADMYKVVNATTVKKGQSTRHPDRTMTAPDGKVIPGIGIRKGADGVMRFRPTPEGIYRLAGDNREEAIRLFQLHGYITPQSTAATQARLTRESVARVAQAAEQHLARAAAQRAARIAEETAGATRRADEIARGIEAAKAAVEAARVAEVAAAAEAEATAAAELAARRVAAPFDNLVGKLDAKAAAAAERKAARDELRARSDDQLGEDLNAAFEADDEAEIVRLSAELDRRDAAVAKAAEKRQRDKINAQLRRDAIKERQAAEIGKLIGEGYGEHEAVEMVTGVTIRSQQMTEALARMRADGNQGRTFEAALKQKFIAVVSDDMLAAEDAIRGASFMSPLGSRRGYPDSHLWFGPEKFAREHASEELKLYWDSRGGRPSLDNLRSLELGGAMESTYTQDFYT
jgi:hypothetical protein